jgi:hypothetical protein
MPSAVRPRSLPFKIIQSFRLACVALGMLDGLTALQAQIAITQVTTSTSDLSNAKVNGVTFDRTTVSVASFKDGAGNIYDANTVALSAYVRRNTAAGNANNSSVWYSQGSPQGSSPSGSFGAPYATDYASLLLGNNLLRGSDNTFANGTDASSGNIERIDFLFTSSGITASSLTSFAVFDRGAIGQHDNVKIAVITGWDPVNNRPTAYGGVLGNITSTDYGATNPVSNFDYNLFRYDTGDNLGWPNYWNDNTETGTQGIGGVAISLTDLGIAPGTTIYGYSLMGYDVTTGGDMANLVDWTNTSYYSADTTGATGTGGIDLSAVNGVLYNRRAPEPSTYGALLMGAGLLFFGYLRRTRRAATR